MKEENSRQTKDWSVNPLLWEVICSTLLTNPAEQCVVRHVVGETFIQESLCLHREALALLDILTIAAVTRIQSLPPVHVHQTLSEKAPPLLARTPTHHSYSRTNGDGRQRPLSEDARTPHKMQVLRSHLKTADAKDCRSDANAQRLNRAKKVDDTIHGICRSKDFRKGDVNGDSIHKLIETKKEDACRLLQQRTISSSSSSSSSDKMRNSAKIIALRQVPSEHAGDSSNAAQPLDFSTLFRNCGAKINAYDIDEVVHELHEAFAAEQVYLNHLVKRLRRALDECIDSDSMARNKTQISCSKEGKAIDCRKVVQEFDRSKDVKDHVKNVNASETLRNELQVRNKHKIDGSKAVKGSDRSKELKEIDRSKEVKDHVKDVDASETLKNELPWGLKTPHFGNKGRIGQKSLSSKAAYLSKPSPLPTLESIKTEKADYVPNTAPSSKVPCKIDKSSPKHVLATRNANKLPALPVNERRKPVSVPFSTHLSS